MSYVTKHQHLRLDRMRRRPTKKMNKEQDRVTSLSMTVFVFKVKIPPLSQVQSQQRTQNDDVHLQLHPVEHYNVDELL